MAADSEQAGVVSGGDRAAPGVAVVRVAPKGGGYDVAKVAAGVREACAAMGWSAEGRGAFGAVIPAGARVVVKPNWVLHRNNGPWGLVPLITHETVVRAIVEEVLASSAARVVVGDAPLQGCDFEALLASTGIGEWAAGVSAGEPRLLPLRDFRRTRSRHRHGVLVQATDQVPISEFVVFDLGRESLLEAVSAPRNVFRVTQYDPRKMWHTHQPGRHQYLIAREIVEADIVVNVPKLKTHQKAGVTCALKNLVGINGNKEFLPHHRVGGTENGGDCYPGRSVVKRSQEVLLDAINMTRSHTVRRLLSVPSRALAAAARRFVDEVGTEGGWSGNDTVWRMALDLNRILMYGRPDGTLADVPQRRVLTIADAIVAGQGFGPLAPEPFALGALLAAESSAALDWIACRLLRLHPQRVPLVRGAFERFRWPLTSGDPATVRAIGPGAADLEIGAFPAPSAYPLGWLDAVDLSGSARPPLGRSSRIAHAQAVPAEE